jgi:hypothetical protein
MMIDIFNHFMPKAYLDRLGTLIPGHVALTAFPRLKTLWDVDARLALLDEFDGLQQVLSLANPPLELIASPDRTPELARIANDALAELCRKHADRFPAFVAALPILAISAMGQTGQSEAIHSPEACASTVVKLTMPDAWSMAVVCTVAISC